MTRKMGENVMIKDLFDSIHKHDFPRIQQLITQHPELINEYGDKNPGLGPQQSTPLILAARLGQTDTVQFLLEQGADITKKTTGCCEFDALHATISEESASLEVVNLLLDAGADINSSNECLYTSPLSQAARIGHIEIVKLLLERGADVNKRSENIGNKTALMEAAEAGHNDIVKLLLRYNADPSLTDVDDQTALMMAMKKGHESVAVLLNDAMKKILQQ